MWPFRRNAAATVRTAEPYWLMRDGIGDARPARAVPATADIVIVGAGITGALVADALVRTGRRILVLDSREVAQGATSASTALLQYEIDTDLVDLAGKIGAQRAALAYRAGVDSFDILERRFPELLARSGYERRESLYLAADEPAVPRLRAECAARAEIGIRCEWLEGDDVRQRYGARRPGAIVSSPGGLIDPVRFTRGVWSGCERHGVEIHTRTPVARIDDAGGKIRLTLVSGDTVIANDVIVCAGFESLDFLPPGIANLNNTFALVTEPLPAASGISAMPLIWESARPYLYARPTADGRLMIGGADVPFKSAAARDLLLHRQVQRIAAAHADLFGRELPPIAYSWAGSFAETLDGLPFIGAVPGLNPRLRFALGYGGNGISYALHAGDIVRAGLEGRAHALDQVFGFARLGAALVPSAASGR